MGGEEDVLDPQAVQVVQVVLKKERWGNIKEERSSSSSHDRPQLTASAKSGLNFSMLLSSF